MTSQSANQERQTIKEIELLKTSVPKAERFSEIKPKIKELNEQKKEVWDKLRVVKSEV